MYDDNTNSDIIFKILTILRLLLSLVIFIFGLIVSQALEVIFWAIVVVIFSIICCIRLMFKIIFKVNQLIAAIIQLVISIVLLIFYSTIEYNRLLEVSIMVIMLISYGMMLYGEGKKQKIKAKSLENTQIKDNVEKWFQDVYMCWIVEISDKEDWNRIAGRDKNVYTIKEYQELLAKDWEIFNKDDLLRRVEGLTTESVEVFRKKITIETIKKHNITNIESHIAWDICRAVMIIGIAYIADYITRDEMREYSIKVCKLIQKEFNSWDHLIRNYIIRCKEYFEEQGHHIDRTGNYEMLRDKKLAYQVDWNLNLE